MNLKQHQVWEKPGSSISRSPGKTSRDSRSCQSRSIYLNGWQTSTEVAPKNIIRKTFSLASLTTLVTTLLATNPYNCIIHEPSERQFETQPLLFWRCIFLFWVLWLLSLCRAMILLNLYVSFVRSFIHLLVVSLYILWLLFCFWWIIFEDFGTQPFSRFGSVVP